MQYDRVAQTSQTSETTAAYLSDVQGTFSKLPVDVIDRIVSLLRQARSQRKQVFLFGNGGSAATASHLACDWSKGTNRQGRPRLRVVTLTDNVSLISAWANDSSYEEIFAQQLEDQIEPGDIAVGISASGRSPNVLNGLKVARAAGATTVGLTGFDGGELKNLVDHCIIVPRDRIDQIEDVHLMLGHVIACCLRS